MSDSQPVDKASIQASELRAIDSEVAEGIARTIAPPAVGRPTSYTQEVAIRICEGIARRVPLARLCDEDDSLPALSTVYKWRRDVPEFSELYARAREDQADYLAEDTLTVSDDIDIPSDHKRIMVDTRKWLAAKFRPRHYADKVQTELSGPNGQPVAVITADTDPETAARLYRQLLGQ